MESEEDKETTYDTNSTTAEECLEDIDMSSYIIADSIATMNDTIDEFLNKQMYYHTLLKNCEKIAEEKNPENYFEEVYKYLTGNS